MIPLALALVLQAEPEPVDVHFVMWKPHHPEAWDRLLADFHAKHPGIRVRVEIGPHSSTELHTMIVTKLRNRDASIDCFLLDVVWPTEFARAGYLEPVDEDRSAFFPGTVEACTVDGTLVAVPFTIDAGVLFYRRDLLEKHGLRPPRSWEELVEQAERIAREEKTPGLVGYTAQFDRYEGLVCNLLEIAGGDLLDPARRRAATEFVRTQILGRAAPRSVLNQREPQSRAVFVQGEAVFHRNWPGTWQIANDPRESRIAGRVGIAPLPTSCLGGWQVGIAAHSRRKEAARIFVRYLASFEAQKTLTLLTAQTHSRRAVLDDPEVLAKHPHLAELKPILESARPRPKLANYHEESDRLQSELYEEISGSRRGKTWIPALVGAGLLALLLFAVARGRA